MRDRWQADARAVEAESAIASVVAAMIIVALGLGGVVGAGIAASVMR